MINEIKTPDIPALPATTQKEVKTAFVIIKDWARLVSLELNKRINNTVTLFYSILYPKNNQALVYDETSGYWKNKYIDHTWLQGILQADDTSSSTVGGKHVTDAMVKKYEDHRLITDGNPHGTNWDQVESTASYIPFNTSPTGVPTTPGTQAWNSNEDCMDIYALNNIIQVGQELAPLYRNATGADITDMTPVMFAGTLGASGRIKIRKAIADGTYPSDYTVGITTETITNDNDGHVTWFGKVRGVDTTGAPFGETWNEGDILYVSPTTAGYLTNVAPNAPDLRITIAAVINKHAINGTIFVRPTWGQKLVDLDDVDGAVPVLNDVLQFNGTVWEPASLSVLGGVDVKQTEIDFGSTPISDKEFTITDASVTGTSQIVVSVAYENTTNNTADEVVATGLMVTAGKPTSGSFTLTAWSNTDLLVGKYKVNYIVG